MNILSSTDVTLNILGLSDNSSKNIINNISVPVLCNKLIKHHCGARVDRKRLIKSFHLTDEDQMRLSIKLSPDKDDLWSKLKYCGSTITQDMFYNVNMKGNKKSNHKLLTDTYSQEFIDLFEKLWANDKILRHIEWGLLRIGSFNRPDLLFVDLPQNINNLIDLWSSNILNEEMGKSLLFKCKNMEIYDELRRWYKLDTSHCVIILADTYDSIIDEFNETLLTERFTNRIKSVRHLTIKFYK